MNEPINSAATSNGATSPRCTDGLCIAIVKNKSCIDTAASRLADEMDSKGAHTGILLVGSEFARSFFGPVPQEWLNRGIGIVVSRCDDLAAEADALLSEYDLGLKAVEADQRRRGELAGQRVGQAAPKVQAEPRMSDSRNNQQYTDPFTAQRTVAERVYVRIPAATGSRSGPVQTAASAGNVGSRVIGGLVQADHTMWSTSESVQLAGSAGSMGAAAGGNVQGGSDQGGTAQGGGSQGSGTAQATGGETSRHSSSGTAGASGMGMGGHNRPGKH